MASDDSKQRTRDLVELVWNRGEFDQVSDYLTEDYLEHRPDGEIQGIEGLRQLISALRETYPDFHVEVHDAVADDQFVACTYTAGGTMRGDLGKIPATGEPVRVEGLYMGRIEGGRVAEGWNRFDMLSALVQMGVSDPRAAPDSSELVASQQPQPPA